MSAGATAIIAAAVRACWTAARSAANLIRRAAYCSIGATQSTWRTAARSTASGTTWAAVIYTAGITYRTTPEAFRTAFFVRSTPPASTRTTFIIPGDAIAAADLAITCIR